MKKTDIISRMAEGAGITKAQADKALEGLLEAVKDGLKDGGRVLRLWDLARSQWLSARPEDRAESKDWRGDSDT